MRGYFRGWWNHGKSRLRFSTLGKEYYLLEGGNLLVFTWDSPTPQVVFIPWTIKFIRMDLMCIKFDPHTWFTLRFINKLWTKIPWKHQTTPLSLHTGKLKDQIKTVHDNIHDWSRKELLSKLSEKVKWKLNANKQEMGTTKINETVLMHPKIIIIISRNIPKRYWQSIRKINMSISGKKH